MSTPRIGITADIEAPFFKLRREYTDAIVAADGIPLVLTPMEPSHAASLVDGLLIPGGGDLDPGYYGEGISVPDELIKPVDRQRSDFELSLVHEMIKRERPVLGICYGMQLINVVFGGSLYQDIAHSRNVALDHTQGSHRVAFRTSPDMPLSLVGDTEVNSSHHQAVENPGSGLEVFAVAEDGIIEGIYKPHYPFLIGVQWHPERTCACEDKERRLRYTTISSMIFKQFVEKAKG